MSFQKTLGQPAASLPGDFTSANLRGSVLAGTGALVAGPSGVTAGRFAWIDATGTFAANNGSGQPDGFVHRLFGRAVITSYLDATTNLIPGGSEVELFDRGEFWVTNAGAGQVTFGTKVYASLADGSITFGPTGTPPGGAIETNWFALSVGAAGELIKMSSHPEG